MTHLPSGPRPRVSTFDVVNAALMLTVLVVTLYPFLNVLAIAMNESQDTVRGGITVFPRHPTLANFQAIFAYGNIPQAFFISVARTVIGTVLSLGACAMVAYVLSRRDFLGRSLLSRFLAITLYVSGGLIPGFLLIRDLHLMNSFWVYILPTLVNAFNIFMIRSYMDELPIELQESARIDGANDLVIFVRIILPLCAPVLATVALFIAVGQWNSWFDTYLYNGSNPQLSTLQFELMKILQSTQAGADAMHSDQLKTQQITPDSIKMAITIITITPILIVYPFLQRYFVRGMTLGAVKG
ncbi:putative aldouronate transport system permease protein [Deinococcus metalli]|uniref:Putative aldouronate transport system permease protein n=1 Tax=Deinococcus metalli TaxID=1141878 RepID=A0A7W8KFB2_9DEIO|nr:carbohydrate ABC transporter permease [Deinococcus metalli]MBB5375961.1 putative aldouronate transport system permease protein [Deinococcus metalli]GHF35802.1 sugar ABC transporter permease [Deinococcus metalli]